MKTTGKTRCRQIEDKQPGRRENRAAPRLFVKRKPDAPQLVTCRQITAGLRAGATPQNAVKQAIEENAPPDALTVKTRGLARIVKTEPRAA